MRDTGSPTCTVVCLAPFFAGRLCLHLLAPLLWQSLQDGVAQTPRGAAPRPACGPPGPRRRRGPARCAF